MTAQSQNIKHKMKKTINHSIPSQLFVIIQYCVHNVFCCSFIRSNRHFEIYYTCIALWILITGSPSIILFLLSSKIIAKIDCYYNSVLIMNGVFAKVFISIANKLSNFFSRALNGFPVWLLSESSRWRLVSRMEQQQPPQMTAINPRLGALRKMHW